MRQGLEPEAACKEAVDRILRKNPVRAKEIQVGFLALNKKGQYGAYCLQKGFTYAVHDKAGSKVIDGKSHFAE